MLGRGWGWVLVGAALSCGVARPESEAQPDVAITLATIERATAGDVRLADLVAPHEAFVRASDFDGEDAETRGRLVSQGWQATKKSQFDDLGVRLPEKADGAVDVGVSRFERLRLRITLAGAAPTRAVLARGRVVYPEAQSSTDRVFLSSNTALEELLVLRDARAPRSFTWSVGLPSGIENVAERDGGLAFEDATGKPAVTLLAPHAIDARGTTIALGLTWSREASAFSISLPEGDLAFPVVVDPLMTTYGWVDRTASRPPSREAHATAFDPVRGELVLFGGIVVSSMFNDTWLYNGTTWRRATPATSPPARIFHAMAFDPVRGKVVLFGGLDGTYFNDVWTWDGAAWASIATSNPPTGRYGHAMAFDSTRNQMVLFGGYNPSGTYLGDTYTLSGTSWTRMFPTTSPTPRYFHAMAFDVSRQEIVIAGGDVTSGTAGVWTWNGTTWAQSLTSPQPSARTRATMTYDAARSKIVLFGGSGAPYYMNDTWVRTGTTWSAPAVADPPSARFGHSLSFDSARGNVVAFGGTPSNDVVLNDTWTWNGTTWSQPRATAAPSARHRHAMAYDSARDRVVLFGGQIANTNSGYSDTWLWDGTAWTQAHPATVPMDRYSHAMAFDAARGKTVLFGGYNAGGLSETWLWDGTDWAIVNPPTRPPFRDSLAMAYDAVRQNVVLFGGQDGPTALGDTWTWNGTTWTPRSPATSPSARRYHAMAFDTARGQVMLFGGYAATSFMSDTWAWNGTTWTALAPMASPPARAAHVLGFNPSTGDMMVFGGFAASVATSFSDTWTWNGTTWSQPSIGSAPGARVWPAMATDTMRGQLLMFGGFTGFNSTAFNETWSFYPLGSRCTANADCPGAFCNDGVCCSVQTCGTCETCAGPTPGRCTLVLNQEDPDTCALTASKSCNRLGDCKAALGTPAATADACASGFLTDGVCCNLERCGTCETCDASKKERAEFPGQCSAARGGTDPHDDCTADDASTCKNSGQCDGSGRCQLYKAGASCGQSTCNGNRATGQLCSGAGVCDVDPRGVDCTPFACANGGCVATCTSNADCASLHHCDAGACIADRGATCDGDHTLVSATGDRTDCGVYKCQGAACLATCVSKSDCTGDADCTPEHTCVSFAARDGADQNSGCSATRGHATPFAGSFVLAFAYARRRRPNRRART